MRTAELLSVLRTARIDASALEVAEAIWLARYAQPPPQGEHPAGLDQPGGTVAPHGGDGAPERPAGPADEASVALALAGTGPALTAGGYPVRAPATPPRGGAVPPCRRQPAELVDPAGRRAFLVVTDAAADRWYDDSAAAALAQWGRSGPVAILQPLPERLWSRTGLRPRVGRLHT